MVKKLLLWAVGLAVCAVVAIWIGSGFVERTYAKREWPTELGPLQDVPKRFPPAAQSAGATRLADLASAASIDVKPRRRAFEPDKYPRDKSIEAMRRQLAKHLETQFERSSDGIDPLPADVARYLDANAVQLDAVRDHLLGSERVVWESDVRKGFDAPIPNLLGHMHLSRALLARGLEKARTNDPRAWDELRASWELNRGLWERPDFISVLIALATSRMVNGAARKMPLPAPAWTEELFTFDYDTRFAKAQQAEAWAIRNAEPPVERFPRMLRPVASVYYNASGAAAVEAIRSALTEAMRAQACDAEGPAFAAARASIKPRGRWIGPFEVALPNLAGTWQRALRFRAELEATERVLQLRAGQMPAATSRCVDGSWMVAANSLKFTRHVTVPPPGIVYPLEYAR